MALSENSLKIDGIGLPLCQLGVWESAWEWYSLKNIALIGEMWGTHCDGYHLHFDSTTNTKVGIIVNQTEM